MTITIRPGAEELRVVPTDELREGDVVWRHGMRLELEHRRAYRDRGQDVFVFFGRLVGHRPDADGWALGIAQREGGWTIQGNHLAKWVVERRAISAERIRQTAAELRGVADELELMATDELDPARHPALISDLRDLATVLRTEADALAEQLGDRLAVTA